MLTIRMKDEKKQTDRKQRNKCHACGLSRDVRIARAKPQIKSILTQKFSSKTRPRMVGRLDQIKL